MQQRFCQLRARRALLQFKYVPLRTRRALSLYKVYSDITLLVLNETSLKLNNTLLALKWRFLQFVGLLQICSNWSRMSLDWRRVELLTCMMDASCSFSSQRWKSFSVPAATNVSLRPLWEIRIALLSWKQMTMNDSSETDMLIKRQRHIHFEIQTCRQTHKIQPLSKHKSNLPGSFNDLS